MKYLSIFSFLFLTACSSQSVKETLTDQVFGKVTGKEYSRNAAHCPAIKRQCSSGKYQEWAQENGQKACVCN